MLTEKDYCDYDTYGALCELGISHKYVMCLMDEGRLVIHLYDAQKWLREEKKIHITIYSQSQESWQYQITKPHQRLEDGLHGEDFSSFEESLSEGIKEAIKILKEEQDE